MFQIDYGATGSDLSVRVQYNNESLTVLGDTTGITLNPITVSSLINHVSNFTNMTYLARIHLEGVYDFTVGLDNGYIVLIPTLPNKTGRITSISGRGYVVGCLPETRLHRSIMTSTPLKNINPKSVTDIYLDNNLPNTTATLTNAALYELPNLAYNLKSKRNVPPFTNYCLHLTFSNNIVLYRHFLYNDTLETQAFVCEHTPSLDTNCYILLP